MIEIERPFFECWAKTQDYDLSWSIDGEDDPGAYKHVTTRIAWRAWQGRASMPVAKGALSVVETPNDCASDPVGAAYTIEVLTKEVVRLQSLFDNAVMLSAKYERQREQMARAYMRLQCADVPRDPWHGEVCQNLEPPKP